MDLEFTNINKILVIKLRHIGDVLLTVPVFRALKERFPDARVSALVNSGSEDVLSGNPLVEDIFSLDRGGKELSTLARYFKEIGFLRRIRSMGFDMTVDLTGGDRAAVLSFTSGARYRIGWKDSRGFKGKKYCYTHLSRPDGSRHMVLQNLEIVCRYGIDTGDLAVDFYIPHDVRDSVNRILQKSNSQRNAPLVHVHPTSRWLFKCWKDEYMAEVIKWLSDEGITVVLTSSSDKREMERAGKILSLVGKPGNLIDLCGKTTIKQLGAISELSDLFFGVDSAPMHVAAAVGTPVVALFGPTGAFSWGPWDPRFPEAYHERSGTRKAGMHTVIQGERSCIPCGKDGCGGSKISDCLMEISPASVIDVLKKGLKDLKNR